MINWADVDTVLLDMDGTLLDLHFDNYFWLQHLPRRYAAVHALEEEVARQQLISLFEQSRGSLEWYCVDYWSKQLDLDIEALKKEVSHLIAVRPYVEEFLQLLHEKSLKLKLSLTAIEGFFDHIICAHHFHCPKEDQQFWHLLQQAHYFDPQRTLFIDDSAPILAAAEQFGVAYLLTLLQPDSQLAPRECADYPSFHHFDEIMPQGSAERLVL